MVNSSRLGVLSNSRPASSHLGRPISHRFKSGNSNDSQNALLFGLGGGLIGGLLNVLRESKKENGEQDYFQAACLGSLGGAGLGLTLGTQTGRNILIESGKFLGSAAFVSAQVFFEVISTNDSLYQELISGDAGGPFTNLLRGVVL